MSKLPTLSQLLIIISLLLLISSCATLEQETQKSTNESTIAELTTQLEGTWRDSSVDTSYTDHFVENSISFDSNSFTWNSQHYEYTSSTDSVFINSTTIGTWTLEDTILILSGETIRNDEEPIYYFKEFLYEIDSEKLVLDWYRSPGNFTKIFWKQ